MLEARKSDSLRMLLQFVHHFVGSGIYNMPKTWLLSDMYFGICIIGSS